MAFVSSSRLTPRLCIFPFSLSNGDTLNSVIFQKKRSLLVGERESKRGTATRQHVFCRIWMYVITLVCWSSSCMCLKVSLAYKTSPDGGEGVLVSPCRQSLVFLCGSWPSLLLGLHPSTRGGCHFSPSQRKWGYTEVAESHLGQSSE